MKPPPPLLQSKALLTRNTIINIAGQGIPLAVAIFAVPIIIQRAGTDRFGILTLIWLIIGYFGLFDLGLGRALTQKVSQALAAGKTQEIPGLLHASLHITMALGIVAAALLLFFASALVMQVLKIPPSLHQETIVAIEVMAFSLPATLSTACLQGYLEAIQRFDLINWVKATLGGFTLLAPLATLAFSPSLIPIVILLVIGRTTAFLVFFLLCRRSLPTLSKAPKPNSRTIASLFKFGGWMTVSNIIGPLMVYLDRFLIGAIISMAAVAYYATPYEIVTKLWIIPFSVVGVLFPAFAMNYGQNNNQYLIRLFDRGQVYLFMGLYPIALIVITFAREGLTLWLGNEFASNGTVPMQLLMLGVFINSLALIPYTLIQAVGRPDLTAKLHILELPLYIVLLLWLLKKYGIEGAAIAWVLRIILDTVVLFSLVRVKILPEAARPIKKIILAISVSCILICFPASMAQHLAIKLVAVLLVLIFFFYSCWLRLLDTKEKCFLKNFFSNACDR